VLNQVVVLSLIERVWLVKGHPPGCAGRSAKSRVTHTLPRAVWRAGQRVMTRITHPSDLVEFTP
jgi:hypothetical protein